MRVTFCGHRDVAQYLSVRDWLTAVLEQLIREGAELFYLGGYGGFDQLSAGVLRALKGKHPGIKSILALPYLNAKIETAVYDATLYPPLERVPARLAILRRNQWMVDHAARVIAVYNGDVRDICIRQYKQTKTAEALYYPPFCDKL